MKLSEIKGERALDVLADLIDPVASLAKDAELVALMEKDNRVEAIKKLLRDHKQEVITVMAVLEGKTYADYEKEVNLLSLPMALAEAFNDEALRGLFQSQSQSMEQTSSGSAMENTEVGKI